MMFYVLVLTVDIASVRPPFLVQGYDLVVASAVLAKKCACSAAAVVTMGWDI